VGETRLRRFAQACLFLATASLSVQNYEIGKELAERFRVKKEAMVDDIRHGLPLSAVVRRNATFTYYGSPEVLRQRMEMLRERGIGVFRSLRP
jgi:hypothetical protein